MDKINEIYIKEEKIEVEINIKKEKEDDEGEIRRYIKTEPDEFTENENIVHIKEEIPENTDIHLKEEIEVPILPYKLIESNEDNTSMREHIKNGPHISKLNEFHKHNVEKPYSCDMCDYKCAQKRYLKTHIECKHVKEMAFQFSCHLCRYKSITKKQLNEHILDHAKDKTFKCDLCNFGCSKEKLLKIHRQTEHQRKLSCVICQDECVVEGHFGIHFRKPNGGKVITYSRKRNQQKNSEQSAKNS